VRGSGYWQAHEFSNLSATISLAGAWTFLLQAHKEALFLSLCTPGGRLMTVVITNESSLLSRSVIETYYFGVLYFAVPQRRMFIGPVQLPRYLAHRSGSSVSPVIAELETMKVDASLLPPRQCDEETNP
jgi:hypothetical protein